MSGIASLALGAHVATESIVLVSASFVIFVTVPKAALHPPRASPLPAEEVAMANEADRLLRASRLRRGLRDHAGLPFFRG